MIFVSGNIIGSYRAQNIIKVLSDSKMKWFFIPWYLIYGNNKFIKKIVGLLTLFLFFPIRIVLIASSKSLIVLPMNFGHLLFIDMLIAKIFRTRVIFDFYISHYDTAVNDRKLVGPASRKGRYISWLERKLTKWSDVIVCLNRSEANYYKKFMCNNVEEKIEIIPLVVDRVKSRDINSEIGSESFNICWWGTYIPLHGLDKIIEAFSLLKGENVKLYIFGDSAHKSKPYEELVRKLNISDDVIFNHEFTFQNRKLPKFLINNCDLALGNFGDSQKAKTVLVNKLVDALALGIPCMTMKTDGCIEFLSSGDNVIFTNKSPDAENIAESFEFALNNKAKIRYIGRRGHEIYNENFCPEIFSERYLKLLKNV
ncbi:glycosyltransferase [Vibrio breoganii]|nr:glycosyltransferase [Vibrio breoganii]PMI23352.1 hypothetical protein BCU49_17940 [Vibrio breoganii]